MASGNKPKIHSYSEIKSNLLQPSLTSTYNVYLNASQVINGLTTENTTTRESRSKFFEDRGVIGVPSDLLNISCSEASLPGSSLATHEINNDYSGVSEKHVYRRLYDDRAYFTFYVDSDYQIIKFFETWMSWIVGETQYTEQSKRTYNYRVKFPNDYRVNMHIQKYERNFNVENSKFVEYTFIDAYPIDISSMPLSYDSSNLLKCTVSFVYTRYYMENITTANKSQQKTEESSTTAIQNFIGNTTPTGEYISSQPSPEY